MNTSRNSSHNPLRVLLLDDDELMLEIGDEMLRSLGADAVYCAQNGEQGLALLDTCAEPPDLLVCDLRMPGMDGIEFLRHVSLRGYGGDVVLLSGVSSGVLKSAERLAREHGLNFLGVLEKPPAREQLAAMLARTSQGRLSPREMQQAACLSADEARAGLAAGHVELHYQPKVALHERRVLGVECLARWRHPQRGLLPPSTFIDTIEQNGLIDDFTMAVFRRAVAQQRAWADAGRKVPINVNVSMDNLRHIDLPEIMEGIVREAGMNVGDIVLEMTETRLLSDLRVSLDILIRLRLKGFGLSIDDFGTAYSTMETLKQLPFSELKIDRAFVSGAGEDEAARAILESSVRLGKTFALNVVAEGVETEQDWATVAAAGCDEVQGYYVARPMPGSELLAWLAQWENITGEANMSEKPKVLMVDDDPVICELAKLALTEHFQVTALASGEDALRALSGALPDVILLDVEMTPGIDGYETCRRIKDDPAASEIPVIFVSARDRIEDRLKGYMAGGEDYVVKPFDMQELEAKLLRILKAAEERTSLRRQVNEAGSTALIAMTSMSEMGALLQAMKSFAGCTDYPTLADAVLAGLALYGLRGTVQVRTPEGTLTRNEGGDASPLEVSVIAHMTGMERITQFKTHVAITYRTVSLLIHNMPVEDEERCGRLRDHLAMLAEGGEARLVAIAASAEAQRRGMAIERAVGRIGATLTEVDRAQRENQVALRLAMEQLTEKMQSALVSVAISTTQEDYLIGVLQEGLNRLVNTHTGISSVQDQLSSIVGELREMADTR